MEWIKWAAFTPNVFLLLVNVLNCSFQIMINGTIWAKEAPLFPSLLTFSGVENQSDSSAVTMTRRQYGGNGMNGAGTFRLGGVDKQASRAAAAFIL